MLEATTEDVQRKEVPVDEEFVIQYYIECPVCSQVNVQTSIPKKIAEEIERFKN